ncbi:hypothetical protein [Candidatus Regiella insecticola]|uniref:hypothetical protein n=1 Tax=Candidatus Regiella insecticola TaxID=138073 RepID=UPI001596A760|nr:hypothetical protein [Candidatus Regiella insecticola]
MPKDIFQTALRLQKKFNLNHLAEQWGENSDCIHKAFSQATALVIKTLSNHLENIPDIEDDVTDLAANMQNLTANEGSQESSGTKNSRMMQTGKNLLSLLFSTNLENVYATCQLSEEYRIESGQRRSFNEPCCQQCISSF